MKSGRAEIDGRALAPLPEDTILDAAQRLGIAIPTLCHLPRLAPDGGCRLCLVEVEGRERPAAACHTPLRDGMRVRTSTPELERLRAGVRALTEEGRHAAPAQRDHPYLRLDPSLCVLCRRCLHVCEEIQGAFVYSVVGRGGEARLALGSDDTFATSPCTSCGRCVEVCPTGALGDRDGGAATTNGRATRSTCGYCGVGCQVEIEADARGVRRIGGAHDARVNHGQLCAKGRYAHGWSTSPERLTRPLLRVNGRLEPITWPEAIAFAARRLTEIHAASGPTALAALSSSRSTNEAAYLLQKLFRARLGTNNVDCCARVCHASTAEGLREATGTGAASACYDDIELARAIAVVGANPTEAHPVIGARILQAVRRGAKLCVIDPRRIELAEHADVFLQLRPGSNVPLLNALAALLLSRGLFDRGYVAQRCTGLAELSASLPESEIARAAELADVPVAALRAAAELIGAGPTLFVSGLGTSELTQGTASVRALCNLALLTGSVGRRGAGLLPLRGQSNVQGNADMGATPDHFTGYQSLDAPAVRARLADLWGALPPVIPGQRLPELLESARQGALRALWVQGEDLAQSEPDQTRVLDALGRLDFLVVQELFPSRTTELAHLVLPAAGWLEQEGTFTNAERRIQRVRAAVRPPGEARPDWEVIRDVANALGCGWRHPTPERVMDEIALAAPALFGGVSYLRLAGDGLQWPCPDADHPGTARLHEAGFAHGPAPLSRVAFAPGPESDAEGFPYRLITGRVLHQYNVGSQTRRTPARELAGGDFLEIHPDDAAREDLANGRPVRVESRWGSATLPARISERVAPGTLFASFHFPASHTNRLVGPWRDPDSDCPDYKNVAVRLRV